VSGGRALKLEALAARPLAAYDPAPLLRAHSLFGDNRRLIASPLNHRSTQPWGEGLAAMRRAFGLNREGHCLATAPHGWARFHEPQITGGFVHFLTEGTRAQQHARAAAFVRAAFLVADRAADFLDARRILDVTAAAEHPVEAGKRIDILIELELDDESIAGLVIEAKLGADLSQAQLPSYRKHALGRKGWRMDQTAFLVVAPQPARLNRSVLHRNPEWSAQSWWSFLTQLEQSLLPEHDCHDYRRFRRTVWEGVYGS
jgi:hypothetical protein